MLGKWLTAERLNRQMVRGEETGHVVQSGQPDPEPLTGGVRKNPANKGIATKSCSAVRPPPRVRLSNQRTLTLVRTSGGQVTNARTLQTQNPTSVRKGGNANALKYWAEAYPWSQDSHGLLAYGLH
jgi:hypothetical protein